ncbi:hypothetical protein ACOSOMT5_P0693 [Acidiphilium sp. MT5]
MSSVRTIKLGKLLATEIAADESGFAGSIELRGREIAASTPVEALLNRPYKPARSVPRPAPAPALIGAFEFLRCTAREAAELDARGAVALINMETP